MSQDNHGRVEQVSDEWLQEMQRELANLSPAQTVRMSARDICHLGEAISELISLRALSSIPPEGDAVAVGWETPEEWELEQRAFQWNPAWSEDQTRNLIGDLWRQYCFAADPALRTAKPADGWQLVPARMFVEAVAIENAAFMGGGTGDKEQAGGVMWVGEITDDDGAKTYGLHLANAEYPEEGSVTLVAFAAPQENFHEGK